MDYLTWRPRSIHRKPAATVECWYSIAACFRPPPHNWFLAKWRVILSDKSGEGDPGQLAPIMQEPGLVTTICHRSYVGQIASLAIVSCG